MFKILVAVDGSEHSWRTIDVALNIRKAPDTDITLIGIVENIPVIITTIAYSVAETYKDNVKNFASDFLEKASKYCQEKGVTVHTLIEHGQPADTICQVAEKGRFDLVVVGDSGFGKMGKFLLGSVSNRVAHHCNTSVLIVK